MMLNEYTTNDEITYLRDLFMRRGPDAIRQYAAVMHLRCDWGAIDPAAVRGEIAMLLSDTPLLEQRLAARGVVQ